MTPPALLVLIVLAGAALSYGLVALIRRRAVLDLPNLRSLHSVPTPRGGGLAIVLLVLAAALLHGALQGGWRTVGVLVGSGGLLAGLGWWDDTRSLPAWLRLLVQTLVAGVTVGALGHFPALPFPLLGSIPLGAWGVPLTVAWLVGLMNAYNFMDGIDGLAGGVAAAAGLGWMVLAWNGLGSPLGLPFWLACAVTAAGLGFLGHNWQPARIFMGDVSSGFLGYLFGVLPLLGKDPARAWMPALLLVWVFIMDAGLTFLRRAARRESLLSAHRSHLYQRMVAAGWSHAGVSSLYLLLTAAGIGLAVAWVHGQYWAQWGVLAGIPFTWALVSRFGPRWRLFERGLAYLSLVRDMGPGWVLFRVGYTLRRRLGMLARETPPYEWEQRPLVRWLAEDVPSGTEAYHAWRQEHAPAWVYGEVPVLDGPLPWDPRSAVAEADLVLAGSWPYFGHQWVETGFPPPWHRDAVHQVDFDPARHWSEIPELGPYEIKYVWEPSRFSAVYPLVRAYACRREERYAEAFWTLLEDWMAHNAPNRGVNWANGQEAALRLLPLCFGWYAFRRAQASSPARTAALTCLAGALGERIEQDLDFAVHTAGNHAISEAFGLWLCGSIFPELRRSAHYRALGRETLEREVARQIFPDGGYSMYSINYHRFVLQICSLAVRLGQLQGVPFSSRMVERLGRSREFLASLLDPATGAVPCFGSNDGALVLPLDGCDAADYRPTLQLVTYLTCGRRALEPGPWDEVLVWLFGADSLAGMPEPTPLERSRSFPEAGVSVLAGEHSRGTVRCVRYRSRPSHADQLHLDLWLEGVNLAADAGTYLYHGPGIWQNGLSRSGVHNTVTVDGEDQMVALTRFTWGRWARGRLDYIGEQDGVLLWQGTHSGYLRLADPVSHTRRICLFPGDLWLVGDRLTGHRAHTYRLQWLLADGPCRVEAGGAGHQVALDFAGRTYRLLLGSSQPAELDVQRGSADTRGWRSGYYGQKTPVPALALSAEGAGCSFWTLFLPPGADPAAARIAEVLAWLERPLPGMGTGAGKGKTLPENRLKETLHG